jgi:hypothetical protein
MGIVVQPLEAELAAVAEGVLMAGQPGGVDVLRALLRVAAVEEDDALGEGAVR